MTHTITIETQNETDFEQVKNLAQRLGIPFSEKHTDPQIIEQEEALRKFAGSWEGEETGDELVKRSIVPVRIGRVISSYELSAGYQ